MSASVDTRLVQIKLDSSDFQKNAKKTQDSIKQLEKDLELKDATKGFEGITKAANKVDLSGTTSQISNALKKFFGLQEGAAESIGGITKASDKVDMSNIAAAANDVAGDVAKFGVDGVDSISQLTSAADKVDMSPISVAVDQITAKFSMLEVAAITAVQNITNKFVDGASQWVKNMAFGDIQNGWNAYAEKTQSVQTMMSATRQDFEKMVEAGFEGTQIEWVESQMDKLAWYTDETSYNFLDMANNIGKFTSQGINLEEATEQMIGIANWGALAGANANEVSRAMYNISQAMGTGSMKLIDWKSIENANMATKEFKEQVMEIAVAQGTLERVSDGIYHVVGANQDAIVSASNFNEQLASGWFDKGVMQETFSNFGKFSTEIYEVSDMLEQAGQASSASEIMGWINDVKVGDLGFLEELKLTKDQSDALIESLQELGGAEYELSLRSFRAGQEAKTFKEAIDSVHDAAKTAWGSVFQNIFGDYEQGKVLWTALANDLWEIFVGPIKNLNTMLKQWNQSSAHKNLIESLIVGMNAITEAIGVVQEAFQEVFGANFKDFLWTASGMLARFARSLALTDEKTEKIHSVASGIAKVIRAILSITGKIFKTVMVPLGRTVGLLFELIDALIPVRDETNKTGASTIDILGRVFGVIQATLGFIPDILESIVDAIKHFKNGDPFGGIANLIVAPFEALTMSLLKIFGVITGKDMADVEEKVRENFFGAIIGGIRTGLEKLVAAGKAVIDFFKALPGYISEAWKSANAWMNTNWGWNLIGVFKAVSDAVGGFVDRVRQFFRALAGLFSRDLKTHLDSFLILHTEFGAFGDTVIKISSKLKSAASKIKEFFKSFGQPKELEESTEKVNIFVRVWHGVVAVFNKIKDVLTNVYNAIDAGITRLTGKNIKQHFEEIKESVIVTWEKIKGFFSSFAKDKDVEASTEKVGLFQKVWEGLKKVGGAVADWARAAFPVVQAAFEALWEKISPILQKIKEGLGSVDWGAVAKGGGLAAIGIALMKLFKQTDGVMGKEGVGGILANVKEMTGSIKKYFSSLTDQAEQMTKKIKAQNILMIAGAIAILVASMMAISTLDSEGFTNGLTAISSFMVELAAFFIIVDDSTKKASDLTKIGAGLLILTLAIALLVRAMKKMQDMTWDQLSVGLAALSGIMGLFIVFAKLVDTKNATGLAEVAAAMAVLAKAVAWMVPPMLLMAAIQVDALKQGLIALGAIMVMMAGFMVVADKTEVAIKNSAAIGVIAAAIIKMIPSIIILGKLDPKVLLQGGIAIALLMAAFAGFMRLADKSNIALQNSAAIGAIAAALLMLIAPVEKLGAMPLADLAKGVVSVGVLMAGFAGFLKLASGTEIAVKNIVTIAAVAGAIALLVPAISELGYLSWEEIAKGLASIAGISLMIAGFLILIDKFGSDKGSALSMIAAAGAMVIMGFALKLMVQAFMETAGLSWENLGKGMLILGGAVLAVAVAGYAMSKALPGLIGFAAVLLSIGGMILLAGAGFLMFAQGLAVVASLGEKAGDAIKIIGNALAETIPNIMNAISGNIGTFLEQLLKGIMSVMDQIFPLIMQMLPKVAEFVIGLFLSITQVIRDNENEIKLALSSLVRIIFAVLDQAWNSLLTMLRDNWPVFWQFLKQALSDIWDLIVEWAPKLVDFIFNFTLQILTKLEENIGDIVDKIVNVANKAVETLTARVPEITEVTFNLLMTIFTNVIDKTVENLPTIFEKLWELTDALLTQTMDFIVGTDERKGLTQMVTEAILLIIADLAKNIAMFTEALLVVIIDFLAALNKSLWNHKDELVAQLVDVTVIATEFAFDLVIDTINALADTLEEKAPEVRDALINLADAAFKALLEFFGIDSRGVSALFKDTGGNIIQGLINGIKSFASTIWNKIKEPFVIIVDKVKEFFGINSPSKVFDGFGVNIVQGMINGITSFASNIWNNIKTTFSNVISGVRSFFGLDSSLPEMRKIGDNTMAGFANGVNGYGGYGGLWSQVSGVFSNFINNVKAKFKIKSPSKVFEEIGEYVDLGFIQGIDNYSGAVDDSAINMGESMIATLSSYAQQATSLFNDEVEDPVIRPVLDLSEIQNGSANIASMLELSGSDLAINPETGRKIGSLRRRGEGLGTGPVGIGERGFDVGSYSSGLLSSLASSSSLESLISGSSKSDSAFSQVINFTITPTPNQDVNAIADAVERKLTRGIKQRGASF